MATHKGSEGVVKVGSDTVAEVRSYSIEETAETLEDTSMGDTARTYLSSLTTFSGSIDVFWDETDDTGQGALTNGAEVTLNLYPEGDTAGDTYYTGTVFDGMVEASITFQGTGALTETTV
jgi:hypothetical protein